MTNPTTERKVQSILRKAKLKNLEPFVKQTAKLKCKCLVCKKIVYPTLHSILKGQGGCLYCGIEKARLKNRVSSKAALAIIKKAKLKPLEPFTDTKTNWKCKCLICNEIVYPKLNNIQQRKSGCKFCGDAKKGQSRKISQKDAIQTMRNAGLEPLEPYVNALNKWRCRCTRCRSTVFPKYNQIKNGQGGCFKCGHIRGGEKNKLPQDKARKIMLSYGLKPLEPYKNVSTNWKSICLKCKRVVTPRLGGVVANGGGCAYCAGNKLDILEIDLIMSKAKIKPLVKYPGSQKPWKSQCLKCKRTVSPRLVAIKNGTSSGCAYCSKTKVKPNEVMRSMAKAGIKPLVKYPGSHKPWKSKCLKCKRLVYPSWGSIRNGQGGCIFCAEIGINYKAPTYLYVMSHKNFNSIKVGISNIGARQNRIKTHQSLGWQIYKKTNFKNAVQAEKIEREILNFLRIELGLIVHLHSKQMPQGGHTETVDATQIDLPTIWAKVEELSKKRRK